MKDEYLIFPLFQGVGCFGFLLSQNSLSLTKFMENVLKSTIPSKCTINVYFMVNLMELIGIVDIGGFFYNSGQN